MLAMSATARIAGEDGRAHGPDVGQDAAASARAPDARAVTCVIFMAEHGGQLGLGIQVGQQAADARRHSRRRW